MFDDITKSVKAHLYDRATSPLFGAFLISWMAWNHKFLFILFSSESVWDKFNYIEGLLYCGCLNDLFPFLIYPLISASLFIIVYPLLARPFFEFWRKQQKILKEIQQKIEGETPLTIEQSRTIRRALISQQKEYEEQLQKKSEEIQHYKKLAAHQEDLTNSLRREIDRSKISTESGKTISDNQLKKMLQDPGLNFRLVYNPNARRAKNISFNEDGTIGSGRNENEDSWRINRGRLELLQRDGAVHNRFLFHPAAEIFLSTGDKDIKSAIDGQYIIPTT